MPTIEREVVVHASADSVYQIWRNFENFPSLMSNIEEVRDIGYGRSHWRAKGPLGRDGEWDAEITRDEPGREIAWQSVDTAESNVHTSGIVRFESLGDATRVQVSLAYDTPGGGIGETVTKLFANPDRQVEDDLARFKERVESGGEYARTTEKIVGHNTPDAGRTSPADGDATVERPTDDAAATGIASGEPQSQVRGKPAPTEHEHETPLGPGTPNEPSPGRPTTTSTPGGTLGAPTEADLKRDQEEISERSDTRPI
jgi:hypothetical protein